MKQLVGYGAPSLEELEATLPASVTMSVQYPSAGAPAFTFPSRDPVKRIDYVMIRPPERWRVVESRVVEEEAASDHRPLLVVLQRLPAKR